ncbi:hypothetical protein NE237_009399 [Protea cynaroides]|uniref:Uncharacterized protein n=1 Tax=Protea cynaroides TaxID=273540 RepID=A0A9Q0KXV8_9MAGN|nr:hypothetical protein NE237_009399 [Protea cynaroides]
MAASVGGDRMHSDTIDQVSLKETQSVVLAVSTNGCDDLAAGLAGAGQGIAAIGEVSMATLRPLVEGVVGGWKNLTIVTETMGLAITKAISTRGEKMGYLNLELSQRTGGDAKAISVTRPKVIQQEIQRIKGCSRGYCRIGQGLVCQAGGLDPLLHVGEGFPRWFWSRFCQRAAAVEAWLLLVEQMIIDSWKILIRLMGGW